MNATEGSRDFDALETFGSSPRVVLSRTLSSSPPSSSSREDDPRSRGLESSSPGVAGAASSSATRMFPPRRSLCKYTHGAPDSTLRRSSSSTSSRRSSRRSRLLSVVFRVAAAEASGPASCSPASRILSIHPRRTSQVCGAGARSRAASHPAATTFEAWNRASSAAMRRSVAGSAVSAGARGLRRRMKRSSRPLAKTPRHVAPSPEALSSSNAAVSAARSRKASVPAPNTRRSTGSGQSAARADDDPAGWIRRSWFVMPPRMGVTRAEVTPDHSGRRSRHSARTRALNAPGSRDSRPARWGGRENGGGGG